MAILTLRSNSLNQKKTVRRNIPRKIPSVFRKEKGQFEDNDYYIAGL
jgi:hypothetical protein